MYPIVEVEAYEKARLRSATLRLRQGPAELLQRLVADLQARAVRGELARSEATIGTVVEEALVLYAGKHGIAAVRSPQGGAKKKS